MSPPSVVKRRVIYYSEHKNVDALILFPPQSVIKRHCVSNYRHVAVAYGMAGPIRKLPWLNMYPGKRKCRPSQKHHNYYFYSPRFLFLLFSFFLGFFLILYFIYEYVYICYCIHGDFGGEPGEYKRMQRACGPTLDLTSWIPPLVFFSILFSLFLFHSFRFPFFFSFQNSILLCLVVPVASFLPPRNTSQNQCRKDYRKKFK